MKVSVDRVYAVLWEMQLDEAIQQSQLDAVAKRLQISPTLLLSKIAKVDPTADPQQAMTTSKYGPWLLSQLKRADAGYKQVGWIYDNPEAAAEQGLVGVADPKDPGFDLSANAHLRIANSQNWLQWQREEKEKLRKAFENFETLKKIGQAEKLGINPDINSYTITKNFSDALSAIDADKVLSQRAIKRGGFDPLQVPGSEIVHQDENLLVFKTTNSEAAQFHAAKSDWCFKNEDTAESYLNAGPLYVVYTREDSKANEQLGGIPSSVPGWERSAAFTFHSYYGNDDEGEDDDQRLLEIRSVDNSWLDGGNAEKAGLIPVMDKLLQTERVTYGEDSTGLGFEDYVAAGDYSKEDFVGEQHDISEPAEAFMADYRFTVDEIDNDGEINVTDLLSRRAPNELAHEINVDFLRDAPGITIPRGGESIYVSVSSWHEDTWNALESAARGEILDTDAYFDRLSDRQAEAYEEGVRSEFRDSLKDMVTDHKYVENRELLGLPLEDWHSAIQNADDYAIDELFNDAVASGAAEWDDDPDHPGIDTDAIAEWYSPDDVATALEIELPGEGEEAEDEEEAEGDRDLSWVRSWLDDKIRENRYYESVYDARLELQNDLTNKSNIIKGTYGKDPLLPQEIRDIIRDLPLARDGSQPEEKQIHISPNIKVSLPGDKPESEQEPDARDVSWVEDWYARRAPRVLDATWTTLEDARSKWSRAISNTNASMPPDERLTDEEITQFVNAIPFIQNEEGEYRVDPESPERLNVKKMPAQATESRRVMRRIIKGVVG